MKVVLITTDEVLSGIGIRTLSACLRERGHETVLVFLATDMEDLSPICRPEMEALCRGAGLIGISCMTHGVRKAVEVGRALRKTQSAPVMIGGIHASLVPESLLEEFDFVCHGEGDDLIVEMADRLAAGRPVRDIPGLWCKEGQAVVRNASRPLKRELDGYPFPDYDLGHQYVLEGDRHLVPMRPIPHVGQDYFVVLGSRGCPHQCTYCCNSRLKEDFPWRKKVRHYSVDYLIRHMKHLNALFPHIRTYWIDDDTFFAKSLEEIEEFSRRYRSEVGKPFLVLTSPATFSEEKMKLLVQAGMNRLTMGVQSGSDRVNREIYHRPVPSERILEMAQVLKQYSASVIPHYDFIGMNPFETGEDLVRTVRLIRALPPPFFIYNNLAFYPGTELHGRAVAEGWDFSYRVKHSDPNIGLRILRDEPIKHKLFHFLLLGMAGSGERNRMGRVPRFLASETFLALYRALDSLVPRLTNTLVSWCAACLLNNRFRRQMNRVLAPDLAFRLLRRIARIPADCVHFLLDCPRRIRRRVAEWRVRRMLARIPRLTRDRCWCGGELLPFRWHKSYGRCAKCGGCVNRRPVEDLKNLYSSDFYRRYQIGSGYPTNEARADLYRKDGRLERWLDLVQRYGQEKRRVIEVGCAPGVLLAELQSRGYHCIGVEPDEATAKWMRERFGIETTHGLFPDVTLPGCEIFMAYDVLEHSPDPEAFMRRIAQLLEPGGIAILQCPIDRDRLDPPFGQDAALAFKDVEHLFIFTDEAMRELGRRAGLELVTLDEKPWHVSHELCIYRKGAH